MKELPKHLGGHAGITHLDEGLLDYLVNKYNIQSMLDIGCGPGGMVRLAQEKGLNIRGIDGDFTLQYDNDIRSLITVYDFTTIPLDIKVQFDLGWSVEFLEHIAEEYLPNVFNVFKNCKYILCTASTDARNKYHFNTQPREYWIAKFHENGFEYQADEIGDIMAHSTMKRNFIKDTGMFFKRI